MVIGQPIASWQNFDNAKQMSPPSVQQDGDTVVGTGVIRGLDFQNFGLVKNCPGGGHGELVITGRIRTAVSRTESKEVTIPSSISTVTPQPLWVTLPPSTELELSTVTVEFRSKATGKIDATLTVGPQMPQQANGPFKVVLDNDKRQIGLTASG
jgi:hypothetical protein